MKKFFSLLILPLFIMIFSASCSSIKEILSPLLPVQSSVGNESSLSESDESESGTESTSSSSESNSDSSESSSDSSEKPEDTNKYIYNSFTAAEKGRFTELFGEVIPFLPNGEYYVKEYSHQNETGLNFYTFGNTKAEFNEYRKAFSAYTFIESYKDEYGDPWYTYQKGNYYVDMSCYQRYMGDYCVDVYVYVLTGSGDSGDGGDTEIDKVLTNDGKGLPQGTDGVYGVNFEDATYVKNVTEQSSYLEGCPTVGNPGVLVIPVEFSDVTAKSKGYEISAIKNAFEKDGKTDYYSVYDYYRISSYGQLELDITVVDAWFRPQNTSSYYEKATMDYYGEQVEIGDQMVMNEALAYLSKTMDLSKFDSDNNGIIDAVVLITTLDVGEDDFHWAYRYWNLYTDENEEYYEYDGVSANDYLWASYQFLYESYDENGEANYADKTVMNTYTYIHEFGHILGLDDYYDTAGVDEPMGGCDVMDSMLGDHNAYTKFNLGWLTSSRLVTTDTSVTLQLEDFSKNGDTIILANDWDSALGAYQEYYIVVYYTSKGLNVGEGGYFARDGIVVYHVNASLSKYEYDGETYYDVYNNNTHVSDEYGTEDNLIEYVLSDEETYTYVVGNYLPAVKDDGGDTLAYTFTVDALEDGFATLTFTKKS